MKPALLSHLLNGELQGSVINPLPPSADPQSRSDRFPRLSHLHPAPQDIGRLVVKKDGAIAPFLLGLQEDTLLLPVDVLDLHGEELSPANTRFEHQQQHGLIPDVHAGIYYTGGICY